MMLYRRILSALILCSTILVFLTACNPAVYNQAEANIADVTQRNADAKARMVEAEKPTPTLVVNNGLYVDKTPISLARQPTWLRNRVILRGDQLPFSFFSRTVLSDGGRNILLHYQNGLDDKALISMNYSGTIKGALDLLAAKTGYIYYVNGNDVYWNAFVTKTFDIAFMPGASDYMMGVQAQGGSAGGSAASGGAPGAPSTILQDSAANQYSNLKGTLSVWKDLEASIKQLMSPEGKVMVSEATTSVTVRDRPANVNLIARYISNLNNNLSKQVFVKIEILTVTLENDFNFGINWNIVQRAFKHGTYQLVSNNGAPIAIQSVTNLSSTATAITGLNSLNMTTPGELGTQALINALQQQGKVSVVTQPQVLCQNNQVSEIRLTKQTTYLASVQTTSLAGGAGTTGSASVTSQITPGSFVTGLTLYVLPKIFGNRVYLQVNADLSDSTALKTITSNGATLSTTSAPPAGTSIIQAPDTTLKHFNQRSVIASGDTLILAGFKQVTNQVGAQQMLNSQTLGGKTAQELNTETIVLITPYILRGFA